MRPCLLLKESTRVAGPWHLGEEWPRRKDGEIVGSGKRNDLSDACSKLESGSSLSAVMQEFPATFVKFHGGLREYATELRRSRIPYWRRVRVMLMHGATHTGKTRKAMELALALTGDPEDVYVLDASNNQTCWFDGYVGQKVLIIDDFYGWIKYGALLRILDGYRARLEVKGACCISIIY